MLTDKELLENAEKSYDNDFNLELYERIEYFKLPSGVYHKGYLIGHMMAQLEMEKQNDK